MSSISVTRRSSKAFGTAGARERLIALQSAQLTRDVSLLAMRLALAWIFMYHGAGKLLNFKHQGVSPGRLRSFIWRRSPPHT